MEIQKPRVLIMEDEVDLRKALVDKLELEGYTVDSCADGVAGMAAAQKNTPDLLLLDILMPNKDGWEVIDDMSADPVLSEVPIIIVSNLDSSSRVYELTRDSQDIEYLVKSENTIKEVVAKVNDKLGR